MDDQIASAWAGLPAEDRVLAEYLVDAGGPIGAARAHRFLQGQGFRVSQATVSRSLLRLDEVGFTERVGREGRRIRDDARRFLDRRSTHQRRNAMVESIFTEADRTRLIDLLVLRRSLEIEAVRLAVERGDDEDLYAVSASVAAYDQHLSEAGDYSADAIRFHLLLCQATHSAPYILVAEALFPEMDRLEPILVRAAERASQAGRSNTEHAEIAQALVERDADACQSLIDQHFTTMIEWLRLLDEGEVAEFTEQMRRH